MLKPLFRPEVLTSQQQKWLGDIVLIRPVSFTYLTLVAVAITGLLVAYLTFGEYTKKATVTGQLVPDQGLIKVQASQQGLVLVRKVQEGQAVRKGDTLYVISSEKQSSVQGNTQAAVSRQVQERRDSLREDWLKQQSLQQQESSALKRKLLDLRAEMTQLNVEQETQRRRLQSAEETLRRHRELHASKFISDLVLQQKNEELLDQQARLQTLERNKLSAQREINGVQYELASLPNKGRNQLAAIERNITATEQELTENEARREFVVTAPEDGIATSILVDVGQAVNPGSALVSIVPGGSVMEAQLYAPSRAVGFIQPGNKVLLRYQPYPYQKFGQHEGVVKAISRSALQPGELQLASLNNESLYRITVALASQNITAYGQPQKLQAGMQLDADVLLDKRRLYEWVLEPLFSITGRW